MVEQISSADWQEKVIDASRPVLVDFSATWCGPCKAMAPVVEQIAVENAGKIDVYAVDIDEDYEIAQNYKIMSVPTFLAFKGGELIGRKVGAHPKSGLLEMVL